MARLGWQVTGTDRVEQSLATARGRAEDLGFALKVRRSDVKELAAAGLDRFDLVLSCMALDNLIEDGAVEHAISSRPRGVGITFDGSLSTQSPHRHVVRVMRGKRLVVVVGFATLVIACGPKSAASAPPGQSPPSSVAPPTVAAATPSSSVSQSPPPSRFGAALAYESGRRQVVLFGGTDGSGAGGAMGDTWIWDGARWRNASPTTSPPARSFAGLAPDGSGGLILFGGGEPNADPPRSDTWRWDGSTWTELHPAHAPGANLGQRSMAYDAAIHRIVLFDGTQTWEWTGSDWAQISVAGPSTSRGSARQFFGMAFDMVSNRLLVFGGDDFGPPPYTPLSDTWAFDARGWSKITDGGPAGGIAVMSSVDSGLVMLEEDGTWRWDGSRWVHLSPAHFPGCGYFASMAPAGGDQALLVPAKSAFSGGPAAQMWLWSGSDWTILFGVGTASAAGTGSPTGMCA